MHRMISFKDMVQHDAKSSQSSSNLVACYSSTRIPTNALSSVQHRILMSIIQAESCLLYIARNALLLFEQPTSGSSWRISQQRTVHFVLRFENPPRCLRTSGNHLNTFIPTHGQGHYARPTSPEIYWTFGECWRSVDYQLGCHAFHLKSCIRSAPEWVFCMLWEGREKPSSSLSRPGGNDFLHGSLKEYALNQVWTPHLPTVCGVICGGDVDE
ncbi:hypothetical protein Tco_0650363 [Tanacetum coccineum]